MAITFAVRGTSSKAYYAGGNASTTSYGTTSVDSGAGTGIIGNSILNLDQSSFAQHAFVYEAPGNLPATQKMSILIRCAPGDTTNALQLFYVGGTASNWGNQARFSGAGTIASTFNQTPGGASLASQTATFAYVAGTYYDIVYLLDGTLTTGAIKIYVNNVLTATTAFSATRAAMSSFIGGSISIGTQSAQAQSSTRIKVNEFVVWDSIIDPANVLLASGSTAALNGASRTSFVDVANVDGNGINTYSRSRVVNR